MGCRPSRSSLGKIGDTTSDYNRCHLKEFDKARRKMKNNQLKGHRKMPTYNEFSSTSRVYQHQSRRSKVTVRLSTDGSMLEIEQYSFLMAAGDIAENNGNATDNSDACDIHLTAVDDELPVGGERRRSSAPVSTSTRSSDAVFFDCPVQTHLATGVSDARNLMAQTNDKNDIELLQNTDHTFKCHSYVHNNDADINVTENPSGMCKRNMPDDDNTNDASGPLGLNTFKINQDGLCIICNSHKQTVGHHVLPINQTLHCVPETRPAPNLCASADRKTINLIKPSHGIKCLCGGKDANSNVASDCRCEMITDTVAEDSFLGIHDQSTFASLAAIFNAPNTCLYDNQPETRTINVCTTHSRDIVNGNVDALCKLKSAGLYCEQYMKTINNSIKTQNLVYNDHAALEAIADHQRQSTEPSDSETPSYLYDNLRSVSFLGIAPAKSRQNITPITLEHSFVELNSQTKSIDTTAPSIKAKGATKSNIGEESDSPRGYGRTAENVCVLLKSSLEQANECNELQNDRSPKTNSKHDVTMLNDRVVSFGEKCECEFCIRKFCSLTDDQQGSDDGNLEFYSDFDNDAHHTNFTDVDDGEECPSDDDSITSLRHTYTDYSKYRPNADDYHGDRPCGVPRPNSGQHLFSDDENDADIDSSEDEERDVYIDAMETSYV